jgi:hypothetical protein
MATRVPRGARRRGHAPTIDTFHRNRRSSDTFSRARAKASSADRAGHTESAHRPRIMNTARILASALALSLASIAAAQQDGTFPPGGGPGGQDGQRPGGRGGDPAQMVERIMQQDANGDGKLAKDELSGPLAERIFERADANKDGFVDKAELEAFAKAGGMRGGQGGGAGGQRGGQAGGPVNVEGAMKQMNGAYKALKASAMDASTRAADLEAVQRLQMGVVGAKAGAASLRMSAAAKAKFGEDKAAFETAYRRMMLDGAKVALELEYAILDGKAAEAKALVTKLHDMEEKGHELFQADEGGEGAEAPAGDAPRARGNRGNRAPGAPGNN